MVMLLQSQVVYFSPDLVSKLCVWSPVAAKGTVNICYRRSWIIQTGDFFFFACGSIQYFGLGRWIFFLRSATDSLCTVGRDGYLHRDTTMCDTGTWHTSRAKIPLISFQ